MVLRNTATAILLSIGLYSQPFANVTGKVVDQAGNALAGVTVKLLKAGVTGQTSSTGEFSLVTSGLNAWVTQKTVGWGIDLLGTSAVAFHVDQDNTPVHVALFDAQGRQSEVLVDARLGSGDHSAQWTGLKPASQTRFLRVRIGSATTCVALPALGRSSSVGAGGSPAAAALPKRADNAADTLYLYKKMFHPTRKFLATTSVDLGTVKIRGVDGVMKFIPAKDSSFMMGSEEGEAKEKPVHKVKFSKDFYVDSTEVTQQDYQTLTGGSPWVRGQEVSSAKPGVDPLKPAWYLNWFDAAFYCNARSKRDSLDTVYCYQVLEGTAGQDGVMKNLTLRLESNGYRLVTEAQWEYACRAGTTTSYYWGADSAGINDYVVWRKNAYDVPTTSASYGLNKVASKKPNALGLYDMFGNAYEWCHDYSDNTYYTTSPELDPSGPVSYSGSTPYRIVRGGCWKGAFGDIGRSERASSDESAQSSEIGFRVALPAQ